MVYIPLDKMLATLGVLIGLFLICMNIYAVNVTLEMANTYLPERNIGLLDIKLNRFSPGFFGLVYLTGAILLFLTKKAGWYISIGVSSAYSLFMTYYFMTSTRELAIIDYLLFILMIGINSLLLFLLKKQIREKYGIRFGSNSHEQPTIN